MALTLSGPHRSPLLAIVEYEAGNYLTAHFKLINAMARSCLEHNEPLESELSAWRFHAQLFESGLDRIILVSSTAYISLR